jgi:hypothetical protein
LVILYGLINNSWLPTSGPKDLWFFSIIGYWLFSLLAAPFFTPPRDTLGYSMTAMLLLATADLSGVNNLQSEIDTFRWAAVVFAGVTVVLAVVSIALKDAEEKESSWKYKASSVCYNLSTHFGRSEIVFTPPVLISIMGFYQGAPIQLMLLTTLWVFVIFVKPVELLIKAYLIVKSLDIFTEKHKRIGTITRVDDPNIIRVSLNSGDNWKKGKLHISRLHGGGQVYVLPLFSHLQGDERIGTGLISKTVQSPLAGIDEDSCGVYEAFDSALHAELMQELSGFEEDVDLIGFVVERSTISTIRFEVSQKEPLEEGMVVFVKVGDTQVYYQILDAETSEESFSQNPRGTHIVEATQLGLFNDQKGFVKYGWLPKMNTPIFRCSNHDFNIVSGDRTVEIGNLPFSNISMHANIDELVEYHTAILGVTGTGKTDLSLDIIRASVNSGIKVVCVDITGEYKKKLADLDPIYLTIDDAKYQKLQAAIFNVDTGKYGASDEKKFLQNLIDKEILPDIVKSVADFVSSDKNLGFIELPDLSNSQVMLSLIEMFLSCFMDNAKYRWEHTPENEQSQKIQIVLEEAHTIIPESYGSYSKHETKIIVDRIGQIALQGRKYGVGLLIISQRTALVSKTILSQCNTYFTYSLIDQTSLGYLANVYSNSHVKIIPNLKFLELLAFGKALPSERPLLLNRKLKNSSPHNTEDN